MRASIMAKCMSHVQLLTCFECKQFARTTHVHVNNIVAIIQQINVNWISRVICSVCIVRYVRARDSHERFPLCTQNITISDTLNHWSVAVRKYCRHFHDGTVESTTPISPVTQGTANSRACISKCICHMNASILLCPVHINNSFSRAFEPRVLDKCTFSRIKSLKNRKISQKLRFSSFHRRLNHKWLLFFTYETYTR